MGINRRVLENASVLAGSQIVAQIANFGFVIVFARAYGADMLGEYSFALSLGALLAAITSMGGRHLTLRAASEDAHRWNSLVGIFLPLQIGLSVLAAMLVVAGTGLMDAPNEQRWIVVLVCSYQLIVSWSVLAATGFSAQERMTYGGYSEALRSIGVFSIAGAMVWLGFSALHAVTAMPILAGLVFSTLLALAHREFGPPVWRNRASEFRAALRQALPFLGIALASILFLRIGVLMLRTIGGAQAVGVFSAAERLVAAVIILQTMFTNAIYPRLVKLRQTDTTKFRTAVKQAQRLVILIALPAATMLTLLADDLVLLLYGPGYSGTATVLRIVSWIMILRGLSGITSAVALAENRQIEVVFAKLAGVATLVVLSAALIPLHSSVGLAEAAVCAELSVLLTIAWRVRSIALLASIWQPIARTLLACGVAAAAGILLQSGAFPVRAIAVVGAGAFTLWLSGAVRWDDVRSLRAMLATQGRASL